MVSRKPFRIELILCFLLLSVSASAQKLTEIKHYQVNFALALKGGDSLIAIRSFVNNHQQYLLLVHPQTLATKLELQRNYSLSNLKVEQIQMLFKRSVYIKATELALKNSKQLQNAGIDQPIPKERGIALTIDLCPSHKGLDRIVFQSLVNEFKKIAQPVPLAISVSGKWMLKHQEDLDWLQSLVAQRALDITWVNHSYNHEVNGLPLAENFLLASGTNLASEVLENEKLMLKNGLIPSVFFRFPGLISDQAILEKIENYGLIPIGSDAWLAKGQKANLGSIVLIHGNGNEETGIKDFIQLLRTRQVDIKNKQWMLFDLKQGLANELK